METRPGIDQLQEILTRFYLAVMICDPKYLITSTEPAQISKRSIATCISLYHPLPDTGSILITLVS